MGSLNLIIYFREEYVWDNPSKLKGLLTVGHSYSIPGRIFRKQNQQATKSVRDEQILHTYTVGISVNS